MEEKRRHPRVDSLNLIAYACLDEQGNVAMRGMGRTLNVSELGILLETHDRLESEYAVIFDIGIEDEVVDIKGRIVHSKANQNNKFETGIEYTEIDPESLDKLRRFIEAFHESRS
jgi:c-di-GMP-binding flagellar brake protein YcgR